MLTHTPQGRQHPDDADEVLSLKALRVEDSSNFITFAIRIPHNAHFLFSLKPIVVVDLRLGAREVPSSHEEVVGKQIGDTGISTMVWDSSAPTTPATIANVVTAPSIPPYTQARR